MLSQVAPHKSHTFRAGRKAGWQTEFTDEHRHLMHDLAGELLVELGYELSHNWSEGPVAATA